MTDRYRIYCSENKTETLPAGVEVEERYPAFVIATMPEDIADEVHDRYPLEKLPAAQAPPSVDAIEAVEHVATSVPERGPYTMAVRFDRPVANVVSKLLDEVGAELLRPIGSRTFAVRCPNKHVLAQLEDLDHVESIQTFVPTIHLSRGFFEEKPTDLPELIEAHDAAEARDDHEQIFEGLLNAKFFNADDRGRAYRRLRRRGPNGVSETGERGLVIDLVTSQDRLAAVQEIVALDGLERLEEKSLKRYFNDIARNIVGAEVLDPPPAGLGFDGSGEIIAIADSGLDTGDAQTVHPDFRGRVRDLRSLPIVPSLAPYLDNPAGDDGAADRFTGHGTHVAGSALGNGARAQALGLGPIRGIAPGAVLVFQAIDQAMKWNQQGIIAWLQKGQQAPSHGLFGIPDDLEDLFQMAFDQGARIHSNSWGGGKPGVYDAQCSSVDEYVWNHRDLLVVVAAGNDGRDILLAEGIDPGSVTSPAVAKNCLTIGASENARPDRPERYGPGDDFPRPPFATDAVADNADDLAAFSSRGPCANGRRKPDLVAPGTFVLSVRSSQVAANQFAWGSFPPAKQDYMFMGGTSMATPMVAGCAAIVRQFLRQEKGITNPTAALLKAALIHSAQYLPYRFAAPSSAPPADDEQGWGRVTLKKIVRPEAPETVQFVDHTNALPEGEMFELEVNVSDPSVPLRATLVYSDFHGEDLINNLNLLAWAPSDGFRFGNDFDGAGAPDGINNVESVVVADPEPGIWRLQVVASAVPESPQDFALVVSFGAMVQ